MQTPSFQTERVESSSILLALLLPVSRGRGSFGKLLVAVPRTVYLQWGDHILLLASVRVGRQADS